MEKNATKQVYNLYRLQQCDVSDGYELGLVQNMETGDVRLHLKKSGEGGGKIPIQSVNFKCNLLR